MRDDICTYRDGHISERGLLLEVSGLGLGLELLVKLEESEHRQHRDVPCTAAKAR